MAENEKYVTFKWMLGQTLAIIVAIATIGIAVITSVTGKIDTGLSGKVDIIQFEERTKALLKADSDICTLINQFSQDKQITNDRLALIEQHLAILVGRPVTKTDGSIIKK